MPVQGFVPWPPCTKRVGTAAHAFGAVLMPG
jgi:hypothetical protein